MIREWNGYKERLKGLEVFFQPEDERWTCGIFLIDDEYVARVKHHGIELTAGHYMLIGDIPEHNDGIVFSTFEEARDFAAENMGVEWFYASGTMGEGCKKCGCDHPHTVTKPH